MMLKQDKNTCSDDRGNSDGHDEFSTTTFFSDTTMGAANCDTRRVSHIHLQVSHCFVFWSPIQDAFQNAFPNSFRNDALSMFAMMPYPPSISHNIALSS
jgi:hypothetical protein